MTFVKRVESRAQEVTGAYKIEDLDKKEYTTLCWLSDRGYDAGILDSLPGKVKEDGGYTFDPIPEHKAWEIREAAEESEGQDFLASNGSKSLAEKLYKFLDAIV